LRFDASGTTGGSPTGNILKRDARSLDGQYAIFGKVIEGMDVVDKLEVGDTMTKVTVEAGGED